MTKKLWIIAMAAILLSAGAAYSGAATYDRADLDKMYQKARGLALDGKRAEARALCLKIVAECKICYDARILLGRLYAWDKEYDTARTTLQDVLTARPDYLDARNAIVDVELWSGNLKQALDHADRGLAMAPENAELHYKRALALSRIGQNAEAIVAAESALRVQPVYPEAAKLLDSLKSAAPARSAQSSAETTPVNRRKTSGVSMSYKNESFDKTFSDWHTTSVEAHVRAPHGTFVARANSASRFDISGTQVEFEAYTKLDKDIAGFLGMGFSGSKIFPKSRFAVELTKSLTHGYEASLGVRKMRFPSSNTVDTYTVGVAKYYKKWLPTYRYYRTPKSVGNANSHSLSVRRWVSRRPDDYVTLRLGSGSSPDSDVATLAVFNAKTRNIGFDFHYELVRSWFLRGEVGSERQEFAPGLKRKKTTLGLGLEKRF